MSWTFVIRETAPSADNPFNLRTHVEWTNSDTNEVLHTYPIGSDIDKTIKLHCRSILNNVLPDRDAAIAAMAALANTTPDLALSPKETAMQKLFSAQSDLSNALQASQVKTLADPTVQKAYDDLQTAKDALATP